MEGKLSDHPGMFAAGQPRLLRAINERTILELIRRTGTTSRAQIARESGLSKPTVSLALSGLIAAGLVHEVGRATGGKGPSAVLYELNPSAGWVVGIDVGRHWVRAAAADITGTIVARRDERARARSSATLIEQIGTIAHEVAGDAGIRWRQVTHATVGSRRRHRPAAGRRGAGAQPARLRPPRPGRRDPRRAGHRHQLRERRQPGRPRRAVGRGRARRRDVRATCGSAPASAWAS